jgi:acyl carrier protein
MQITFEEFLDLVSNELGFDKNKLNKTTSLRNDLRIDSLSVMNFIINLERKFKMKFNIDNLWAMSTIGEVYELFVQFLNDEDVKING